MERAQRLDPLSLHINSDLGALLYDAGEREKAMAQFERTLELDPEYPKTHFLLGYVHLAEGKVVVVEVTDNGRGIEAARLSTLFEPSFGVDGGRVATTNWGLFISRSIVNDHGGSLEIESTLGRGTTARLSLPRAS